MARLTILPSARQDLIEIGDFIALDNPQRALSFIAEIEARMIEAGQRPASFPSRDDLHEGLRAARHGRYLIFFLALPDHEICPASSAHGNSRRDRQRFRPS